MCKTQEHLAGKEPGKVHLTQHCTTGPLLTRILLIPAENRAGVGISLSRGRGAEPGPGGREGGRDGPGTHRAAPLRGGEVHVGDEEHRLRLQVALGPQEGDLVPSEAREQTAFQTYRWRVQFSSARAAGTGAPLPGAPEKRWGQEGAAAPPGEPRTLPEPGGGSQRAWGGWEGAQQGPGCSPRVPGAAQGSQAEPKGARLNPGVPGCSPRVPG